MRRDQCSRITHVQLGIVSLALAMLASGCEGSCDRHGMAGAQKLEPKLVWTDSIQSGDPGGDKAGPHFYGFHGWSTQHPWGHTVTPSDANGANLSRVRDPLGGSGYAIRQYLVPADGGGRSQMAIWSFADEGFRDLALSGKPVYVAQEWYFPKAIHAKGDPRPWLSLLDWHTTKDGADRWHTNPALMLNPDASMTFRFVWGGPGKINGWNTQWSRRAMPIGEWFDIEMRWQLVRDMTATVSVWIDGELALRQTGAQTALPQHNVVELYIKLYGDDHGATPWSPRGIVKYVRNVRISDKRIWR